MPSPESVSLQIPYTDNEKQFLFLAVQAAVRTFRSINPPCPRVPLCQLSSSSSEFLSSSASQSSQSSHKSHP
jgi:hypothetical protein